MVGRGHRPVRRRHAIVAAALCVICASTLSGAGAAATPQGVVELNKSVVGLTGAATPGDGFSYQLTAQCSSLTVACVDATVTDVLPADLQVLPGELPVSNSSQQVTYDAATRTLTVRFTEPLPPPNPPGSRGLPAGSVRQILVGVRLPDDTPLRDGSTISNSGQITAANAAPSSDSADVDVSIPRIVKPNATKSWSDPDPVARAGAHTRVTLGIGHTSSSSARVTELTVGDSAKDTFDDFDLVSVGPVERFPAGADEVAVAVCTQPLDHPCGAGEYHRGPFGGGPGVDLPAGVDFADVTGVQFVFRNRGGGELPAATDLGRVSFELALRDSARSDGRPIDPTSTQRGANCADPRALESGELVTGAAACAGFAILPNAATLSVDKRLFADSAGSYTPNGVLVAGQTLGATAFTDATNKSPFAVPELTIVDPSATAASRFDDLDIRSIHLRFPRGAGDATVTVECRDGAVHVHGPLHAPPDTAELSDTGCPASSPPARVTAVFRGTNDAGAPAIAADATASLGLHGELKRDVAPGTLSDCADGQIAPGGGHGAAAGTGCANAGIEAPRSTVGGGKTVDQGLTGGQLVAGEPLAFTVTASNSANLPERDFTVQDPADPAAAGNPFELVALTDASLATQPASLASDMAIELLDPAAGDWVPYSSVDPGLLAGARGIRVRLLRGLVPIGGRVTLGYSVVVRDGVPLGSVLTNCQRTTAATAVAAASADRCSPRLDVKAPSAGGAVQKAIVPATVARHLPGVAPQTSQVRLQARNTGTIPLNQIVITDADAAFFDAVDLARLDAVNFPPGADRVQVDACTTGCAAGAFIAGVPTASTRPRLPAGVAVGDVQGLRFTFTSANRDYLLTPGANLPQGGPCPGASVCFSVAPRVDLRSDPATVVPDSLTDTTSAVGESQLQPPGTTFPFGESTAPLDVVKGTAQLAVSKSTSTPVAGPGEPIPFDLQVRNTGTGAVPDLVVSEPVPARLVFDQSFTGADGLPFTVESTVPAGTPPLPAPVFSPERDPADPSKITGLRWSFPGFDLLPGSTVKIGIRTTLAPGVASQEKVVNSFGASSGDPATHAQLRCDPESSAVTDGPYGGGRYCVTRATVTSRGGSALDAQKWVTGDPALGFYDTATDTYVAPGDIACPLLRFDGADYTRYPCIALVLAGQRFHFLLTVTNIGTTPATEVRLIDELPHHGDTGVKLTGEHRDTQWNPRPHLDASPSLITARGVRGDATFGFTESLSPCTDVLLSPPRSCPARALDRGFSDGSAGFYADVTFPDRLAPGDGFAISVPMDAPVNLAGDGDLPIAWNSFAHTDFVQRPGATSPIQLPFVEPPKVGVALPFGSLEIVKQQTGPLAGQAHPPFQVEYRCTVTPAGGTPQPVAEGHGEFSAAAPLTIPHVPVGASCSVWETDTGGGASTHTVPADALVTVIRAARNGSTQLLLVNDFPAPVPPPAPPAGTPAQDAQLLVTKQVDHASAAVGEPLIYTITVANAGPAAATDVRLTDSPSQRVTVLGTSVSQGSCTAASPLNCALGILPAGATATVTLEESGTRGGVLRNSASATADQPNPTPSSATASANAQLRVVPTRLRMTKTPASLRVSAGSAVSYEIRVQALGAAPALDVRVCDRLAPNLGLISAPGAQLHNGVPCWTIPLLDPHTPRSFTVTVAALNTPAEITTGDTATAGALNAPAVQARAVLRIRPRRPGPSPVTG